MSKKLNYEDIRQAFGNEGYKLLSIEYKGSGKKLDYECPCGHIHLGNKGMSWDNFKQGKRCPECQREKTSKIKRKDYRTIKNAFENEGYTLLTKEEDYKNAHTKLDYICPKGHYHSIIWNSFNGGNRCPECATEFTKNKLKMDYNEIKEGIEKEGYILLSTEEEYENNTFKLRMVCPQGHYCEISWGNFQQGRRCRKCAIFSNAKSQRTDFKIIQKSFLEEGYILLSKESDYTNRDSKLYFICDNGHCNNITWGNFKEGCRCSKCNSPKGERKIIKILDKLKLKYIHNNSIWEDNNLRPDFFLPDYNLVIEFDGIQHFEPVEHFGGETNFKITQQRDLEKNKYCENNNINILRIPYWEFENIENIICQEIEKLKTFND